MNYSDLLHPPGDKVSLGEMALIRGKLPERVKTAIPSCMYTEDKRFDYEVLILLFWTRRTREEIEEHFRTVQEAVEKAAALLRDSELDSADEVSDAIKVGVEKTVNPPEDPERTAEI